MTLFHYVVLNLDVFLIKHDLGYNMANLHIYQQKTAKSFIFLIIPLNLFTT